MATPVRVVAGGLLVAHGLVHLLYLAPDVREFSLQDSWLVPALASRPVGIALLAVTVAAFVLLGLAVWGVPWPWLSGAWPAITVVASVASLILLGVFWNAQLIVGVLLDLALIAVVVLRPGWTGQLG